MQFPSWQSQYSRIIWERTTHSCWGLGGPLRGAQLVLRRSGPLGHRRTQRPQLEPCLLAASYWFLLKAGSSRGASCLQGPSPCFPAHSLAACSGFTGSSRPLDGGMGHGGEAGYESPWRWWWAAPGLRVQSSASLYPPFQPPTLVSIFDDGSMFGGGSSSLCLSNPSFSLHEVRIILVQQEKLHWTESNVLNIRQIHAGLCK